MTPLHWAAFHGDADLTQLLLEEGAVQTPNIYGYYPVDIAGFSKNIEVVLIYCKYLEKQILG